MTVVDYRSEFFQVRQGPYFCCFCDLPVTILSGSTKWSLTVHHKDGNKENNDPTNWDAAHWGCHSSFHNKNNKAFLGRKHTDEAKTKMSMAGKGKPKKAAHREKLAEHCRKMHTDPVLNERRRAAVIAANKRRGSDGR